MGTLHRRDLNGSGLSENNNGMRQGKYKYDKDTVYNWIGAYKASSDVSGIDFNLKQLKSFEIQITAGGGYSTGTKQLGILVGQEWDNITDANMITYLNSIKTTSKNLLLLSINARGTQNFTISSTKYSDFLKELNTAFRAGKKTLIFFNPTDYAISDDDVDGGETGNYTANYMSSSSFSMSNFEQEDALGSIAQPPTSLTLSSSAQIQIQDAQSRKYSVSWTLGGTTITSAISA